jgi:hypothetical protein
VRVFEQRAYDADQSVALDWAGRTIFSDITILAAGPASERSRSTAVSSHLLMPFVMCSNKGPFDERRISSRELMLFSEDLIDGCD